MRRVLLAAALLLASVAGAADADPPGSVYHLEASLEDAEGRVRGLDLHRGHPVLVTLFYGSCRATCPLIIETLRATEKRVPENRRANLRVLAISIDPEHDTPAALAELARDRRIDTTRWTLARTDATSVRKIAAVLGVQYRPLPQGGFNHSTVIALLSPTGEIEARTAKLGPPDEILLARLRLP
jgi:protein SCO1/2